MLTLMKREEIIKTLRDREADLRARGVAHAALFGSVARGDDGPDSDIDIMVEIAPDAGVGLFQYVGIVHYLEELVPHARRRGEPRRPEIPCPAKRRTRSDLCPSDSVRLALFDIRDCILSARDFTEGLSYEAFKAAAFFRGDAGA